MDNKCWLAKGFILGVGGISGLLFATNSPAQTTPAGSPLVLSGAATPQRRLLRQPSNLSSDGSGTPSPGLRALLLNPPVSVITPSECDSPLENDGGVPFSNEVAKRLEGLLAVEREKEAIIVLQKHVRGYLARKKLAQQILLSDYIAELEEERSWVHNMIEQEYPEHSILYDSDPACLNEMSYDDGMYRSIILQSQKDKPDCLLVYNRRTRELMSASLENCKEITIAGRTYNMDTGEITSDTENEE